MSSHVDLVLLTYLFMPIHYQISLVQVFIR